jgi:hypothetical protein
MSEKEKKIRNLWYLQRLGMWKIKHTIL